MSDKPITLKQLENLVEQVNELKPELHMNQRSYDAVVSLGYMETLNQQCHVIINNYQEDNQAIFLQKKIVNVKLEFQV